MALLTALDTASRPDASESHIQPEDENVEEMSRRSGNDRRSEEAPIHNDKRGQDDRRGAVRESDKIIDFMKGIPLFKSFSDDQYKAFLNVCSIKTIKQDSFLCRENEPADELYVLMKVKLKVMKGYTLVTILSPMGLVGEIGVFTSGKRTADVLAQTDSTVIRIHKNELFGLMKANASLSQRLLLNTIHDLSSKLQEDNRIIEELRNRKTTMVL